MHYTLHVWRQPGPNAPGRMVEYQAADIAGDMSVLEMLDLVNERLAERGEDPIAFSHDCREGICGSCALMINGVAHGPEKGAATCQVHMRRFPDGSHITLEPWRALAFPLIKDLVVDRSALDRIIAAGGFITAATGGARDANAILVPKGDADHAMDAAACIGCGACVAACPNGAASLFTGAKISHLGLLPQGQPERSRRVLAMVARMDSEGFGACTWFGECQEACPKEISIDTIARMNRDFLRAGVESGALGARHPQAPAALHTRLPTMVRTAEVSEGPSSFKDREVNQGGADAVEKTTYITGQGTDPRAPDPATVSARVPSGEVGPVVWIVLAIVVLVALLYAIGIGR